MAIWRFCHACISCGRCIMMLCTVLFTMLEHVTGLQGSDLAQNALFEAQALRLPQAKQPIQVHDLQESSRYV